MRRLAIGGSALGVATLLAGTGEPQAAGFALKEQSTTAQGCLLYTSPSPRDLSTSRMPSSA